jgi:class 3 adenylate cyclase/predicted ATPase
VSICASCGQANSDGDPLCGSCGQPLGVRAAERRTVTIVASDLKGSTALGERLDAESLREVLALYFDAMQRCLKSHGGSIQKIVGDAIIAVFGLQTAREDDALRAVQAAAETQAALAVLNEQLDRRWGVRLVNRTGIATGEVVGGVEREGEQILTGDVVQLAGALEQAAPATEVLIGESTLHEVADFVTVEAVDPVTPKGAMGPMPAYRLVSVKAHLEIDPARNGATSVSSSSRETRKTVTIVFADLAVTTMDGEPLAADVLQDVMARAFDVSQQALLRHGATVEKFIGDAVMAVLGLPVRHEDDGIRAVRAALDLRTGLASLATTLERDEAIRLEVAIGVNTGEVVAGDASLGQRLVTGDTVNTAARLEQAAGPGEILLGQETMALMRDVVEADEVAPLTLKGKSQPVRAFRLIALTSGDRADRRPAGAMVGRAQEMTLLAKAFEATVTDRACHMVTLVGDAGVGKTRLTQEFLTSVAARAQVVRGRCLPYGEGITFWPIVEIVGAVAGIKESDTPVIARRRLRRLVGDEAVADRVAAAVGLLEAPFQVAELVWGIRRLFEILAVERPLVVVFDDIHWAEATFLELIGRLTATIESAPVLLLCTARQELLAKEPAWAEAAGQRRIDLTPLSDSDASQVIENLLGRAGLPDDARAKVVAAAEGNPLFVEQLVSMLIDGGLLRLADGRWEPTGDLGAVAIPPTIHALLAARLDQLPEDARAVVDPASVAGLVFARAALQAIVGEDVRHQVPAQLDVLEARQMVRRQSPADDDIDEYRFGHLMIRDAAYAGLLKRTRALLHERFAAWVDEAYRATDRATEVEEITGYHLEQAHRYLSELGTLDEHGIGLGIDASDRLASAGERAYVRGDMPAMASLFRRAAMVLPESDARWARLLFRHGLALWATGEYEAADLALDAAIEAAAAKGDEALTLTARLERLMNRFYEDPGTIEGRTEDHVQEAIEALEALGDHEGSARAWLAMAGVRMVDAQWGAAEQAIERVIEHARLAGDRVLERRAAPNLAMCAEYGPTRVADAIRICESIIAEAAGDRNVEAIALRALAHMHGMTGDFAAARDEYRRARTTLEQFGWRFQASLGSMVSGPVELLAGDPVAAEAELRTDYQTLGRLGDRNYISTVAGYLAQALYQQGRFDEAGEFATISREVADADDIATQVLWRSVNAKVLARRGLLKEANGLAREAVELSRAEDDPIDQANAQMDLGEVLLLAGDAGAAAQAVDAALRLYESKGNLVSALSAVQLLGTLRGNEPPA